MNMTKNIEINVMHSDILFDLGDTAWIRYGRNSNSLKNWREVTIVAIKFDEERKWYGKDWDSYNLKNQPEVWLSVRYKVRWNVGTDDNPIWRFCLKDSRCVYESPNEFIDHSMEIKKAKIEKLKAELAALEGTLNG